MSNTEPIFEYHYAFRFFRAIGTWAIALIVAVFPALIVGSIMNTTIGDAVSNYLCFPLYLLIMLVLVLASRPVIKAVRLEQEKLIWHEYGKRKVEIEQSQVTGLRAEKKALVFKSAGEVKKFKLQRLPQKEQAILAHRLIRWTPASALPDETMEYLQNWKKERDRLLGNIEHKTAVVASSYKYTVFFHSLITFCLLLLLAVTLYAVYHEGLAVFLLALFLWAIPLLIVLLLWVQTSYRTFQVEPAGVRYTQDRQQTFWRWEEIEAAELNLPRQEIKLWRGNRYKRLLLHRMNEPDLVQALEYWRQNLLVYDIPMV